ncbi:MAG: YbcC family protein [Bacteroidia bacterium]
MNDVYKHSISDKLNIDSEIAQIINKLKHYLPSQNPLKDFVHHNTLHAFQHYNFHDGLEKASKIFGFKTYLSLNTYRKLYRDNKINNKILDAIIIDRKGENNLEKWKNKLLQQQYDENLICRIGNVRNEWLKQLQFNIDKASHPTIFRILSSYLDQGISIWNFPIQEKSFLNSIRELEKNSFSKIFYSNRAIELLFNKKTKIYDLLNILVGEKTLFEHYLFDQQFAHPGWSGMVSVLEDNPNSLLDKRKISFEEFIYFELLLEINFLDKKFGEGKWKPVSNFNFDLKYKNLFENIEHSELFEVYALWQEIYEWTYYDQVLLGLQLGKNQPEISSKQMQAILCIDDRECSFRRYIEELIPYSETYGTAGFFNVEFYFQPEHGKFYTKSCPAPVTPKVLIKEYEAKKRHSAEWHLNKKGNGIFAGWIVSQTLGFFSALKLAKNIFKPSDSPLHVSSFQHMDKNGKLKIEATDDLKTSHGLQLGFSVTEMTDRLEGLLRSIGLTENFAPLIYLIGHGASSVNNTHYAGYDCGACSGRAGSVNARVAAEIGNHPKVRQELKKRGIHIPNETHFIAALHDTTKDEIEFYDEQNIPESLKSKHKEFIIQFNLALDKNAKERSRRFRIMDSTKTAKEIHELVKLRALSLFEPRPEWNHATNAICIVGRRESCKHLFLDRRAFMNSYDYSKDAEGKYLLNILKAVAPVCGGINLEYYFSKVDNDKLGAGTKLPHNVIGLIGVANGMDGDLRPGLPAQMVNIHDPLRLMVIVEHFPDVILNTLNQNQATKEWFENNWIHLCALHPKSKEIYVYTNDEFIKYETVNRELPIAENLERLFETISGDLPVYLLKN